MTTVIVDAGRRSWLIGAGAVSLMPWLTTVAGRAMASDAPSWEAELKRITGGARPVDGKLVVDLPEIAENGNTVPFAIAVDSPMTEADYVKTVHVLATGNPVAMISSFHFTPASGRAAVAGRLRLAKTQDIVTVAELSSGKFLVNRKSVKVTIGGCGG